MSELRIILKNQPDLKKKVFIEVGQKISKSRKSSRKKLDGIAKKLNINVEMLKQIEEGDISKFPPSVHITGFLRAFSEKVNCDISSELEQLVEEKEHKNNIKITEKRFKMRIFTFLIIFLSILFVAIIFLNSSKESDNINKLTKKSMISEFKIQENNYEQLVDAKENNENFKQNTESIENNQFEEKMIETKFFEVLFLEETWIEVFDKDKSLIKNGLFNVGQSLKFFFDTVDSDFFIKSGNLGGFQIFYNNEFFAPFGLSGQVSNGFYVKKKISSIYDIKAMKNEY